jgi:hypothetical protein
VGNDVDARDKAGHADMFGGNRSNRPDIEPLYFPPIEITGILAPNVSSRTPRRNNSPLHETIFPFWSRHPETMAD